MAALVDVLGEAPSVSYAPPAIFPMSAPAFEPAGNVDRGEPPAAPLGVYVHVPFCNYKCSYCFYATEIASAGAASRYVDALIRELSWIRIGTELTQLYVGGGTPTTLAPALLDRLLTAVFARVSRGRAVHTVECSPESVTAEHVAVLVRHGIERVSLGLQSGDESIRAAVHRRHDNGDVRRALELLVGSGLVVNADLIYGLPGQSQASFRADFELAAQAGVHSVTSYNLRVNEQTPVGRQLTDGDRLDALALVRWREIARAVAEANGFRQTRWHTFRRESPATAAAAATRFRDETGWGHQIGIGMSARSRLGNVVFRNHLRQTNYLDRIEAGRSPVESIRVLDALEQRLRFVTLTLGDGEPLDRHAYRQSFATDVDDDFSEPLRRLTDAHLLSDDGQRVVLTDRGKLVYDLATRAFYPDRIRRWMHDRQGAGSPRGTVRTAP